VHRLEPYDIRIAILYIQLMFSGIIIYKYIYINCFEQTTDLISHC